jgi:hypothetical protein
MRKIVSFIFCFLFALNAYAQISDIDLERPQNERENTQTHQDDSKYIFLSYENAPAEVYVGEIFPVTLKAIITRDDYEKIATFMLEDNNFNVLNIKNKWNKEANNNYFTNTLYLQALKPTPKLPTFLIELVNGETTIEDAELEGESIDIRKVSGDAKFSGVVAQSLAVKNEITNKFDDKSLIVSLEIEATYSNLRDFKLRNQNNGSIDAFKDDISLQYIEYDIIVPNYIQELEFTYFDTLNHDFRLVKVPLHIKSDDVSTHTDLNPKENKFKLYKDILFGTLCALMILIFIFKRYKSALFAAILMGIYLFYANNPFNKITLSADSVIRVLPTEKSSVFHITEGSLEVERLMSKN